MHDLNTIQRLNQAAFEAGPGKALVAGRFVVFRFTGLHFVSFDTFETHAEALADLDARVASRSPDERYALGRPMQTIDDAVAA